MNNPFLSTITIGIEDVLNPYLIALLHILATIAIYCSGLAMMIKLCCYISVIIHALVAWYYHRQPAKVMVNLSSDNEWSLALSEEQSFRVATVDKGVFISPYLIILPLLIEHQRHTFLITPKTSNQFRYLAIRLRFSIAV